MATAKRTTDHKEIRQWVERNNGRPVQVEGTGGMLRIDFGKPEQRLQPLEWADFFEVFDSSNIAFLYDPSGHMHKFVARGRGEVRPKRAAHAARKKSSRKTSSSRKKRTSTRKKSSSTRKKGKKSGRKYGPKAQRKVGRAMHEMKRGELKSGRSGKKVKSRKQAVAIGLSEARRSGGKVPPNPNRKGSRKRS